MTQQTETNVVPIQIIQIFSTNLISYEIVLTAFLQFIHIFLIQMLKKYFDLFLFSIIGRSDSSLTSQSTYAYIKIEIEFLLTQKDQMMLLCLTPSLRNPLSAIVLVFNLRELP